jgi:hypothetical protein
MIDAHTGRRSAASTVIPGPYPNAAPMRWHATITATQTAMMPSPGTSASRSSQPESPPSCRSTTAFSTGTHAFQLSSPDLRNTADSASAIQA